MRPPDSQQTIAFIQACASQSGTATLFDDTVTAILAEGTNRNPRSIKRIINSFVLEYRLDLSWRQPQLGSARPSGRPSAAEDGRHLGDRRAQAAAVPWVHCCPA
jgi:hypothetical protein